MKKLLCLVLSLVFLFSFAACKEDTDKDNGNNIDIEYYVNLGQMPECEYSLGTDVSKIKDELSADYDSSEIEEMVYNVSDMGDYTLIDNGQFKYYYLNGEDSLSYMVNFDTAFGYEIGTLIVEVENALSDFEYKTEEISKDNAFFLFGSPEGSVIKCEFKENTVMFVFENSALCATAIYKTSDWIGE